MAPLARRGNGQDGCRISGSGSSCRANRAREAAMRRARAIVCALMTSLAAAAAPARAESVVRWVSANGVGPWEPTNTDDPSANSQAQVYEGLTLTDSDLALRPALATDWTLVRPDTWRFRLRPGV